MVRRSTKGRVNKPKKVARKPTEKELFLLDKVKSQLEAFKPTHEAPLIDQPSMLRRSWNQEVPMSIAEYIRMDPCWMSTMGGRFAGRILGEKR